MKSFAMLRATQWGKGSLMKVGVGYSDNPESWEAGLEAAKMAVARAGRADTCDMALLFSTARQDQAALLGAVASVIGESVPIYGGGAAGVITNDYFGYAGDQIATACFWLDGVGCEVIIEGGLNESEEETGKRLGRRLSDIGTGAESPVMLFYDAFDCTEGARLLMATWLMDGIEKGLGFLPDLTGVGMIGSHGPVPYQQWIGDKLGMFNAIALAFSGDIRMDSVIMHGCLPATGYYTVTKAFGQVILEINGKPAIQFIDGLLGSMIDPEQYPFFLTFGVNHGERWGEYDEDLYASRLCLAIDRASGGIVMFEPDMVEGTEFRLMLHSFELNYFKPKIDRVFDETEGREPIFAVYIDCAGRCSGYSGNDLEDAVAVQEAVRGRVPILGLYAGVEIASIGGRPRGLDWTGVFCLFTQSRGGASGADADAGVSASSAGTGKRQTLPAWGTSDTGPDGKEAPAEASRQFLERLCEQVAAKYLALDASSIAIRRELEQKRRGFSLLSELSVTLRQATDYETVMSSVTKRINAALNMQRTAVLLNDGNGMLFAEILQGYSVQEMAELSGQYIMMPAELLDPDGAVIVTGADSPERYKDLRERLGLQYFISSPIVLQGEVHALLFTGRLVEAEPYLLRLSRSDMETVQAIGALISSILAGRRLADRFKKEKSEFYASVSHEIRTPMNAVRAMARIAGKMGGQSETQQKIIKLGVQAADTLTSAIEMILDFSRLDSGHFPLTIKEFSIREMIDGISGMVRSEAEDKALALTVSVDEAVPGFVLGDRVRLQQALLNIVVNAVKFTEMGGVGIRVLREDTGAESEAHLVFEIMDSGVGMTEAQMAEIYVPLYSGDTSYSRKQRGLGLGLPVSNSLISLMGGSITCTSRPGEGSVFRVALPMPLPKKADKGEDGAADESGTDSLQGLRVLVAEDNFINQMIIEELLDLVGVEVTMANNGIEAIAKLHEKSFDVVLMDIQMPDMDGLTAAAKIREDKRFDSLPILAMTAHSALENIRESFEAGMNDHLTKPVDKENLYSALAKWSGK